VTVRVAPVQGLFSRLAWTWAFIGGTHDHLVPPRILSGSRTACGRYPVAPGDLRERSLFLVSAHCSRCLAKNGGVEE